MTALIYGWLDDSRRGPIWTIGGYIGADHRWAAFETLWPMAMANHDVPYFHMKEMADPNGVYAKWHPPQAHREERADYFAGMAKVIGQCRLVGIGSTVRQRDLDKFNAEFGQSLEPYSLAAYGCMLLAARENLEGMTIELVFDHVEKASSKLAKAKEYAVSDIVYDPDVCKNVVAKPLSKELTWREIPALQAADLYAWELRKNHEFIGDWFELEDKPDDWDERTDHLGKWLDAKFGDRSPIIRRSASALVTGNEIYHLVWDYKNLVDSHISRGGVWA